MCMVSMCNCHIIFLLLLLLLFFSFPHLQMMKSRCIFIIGLIAVFLLEIIIWRSSSTEFGVKTAFLFTPVKMGSVIAEQAEVLSFISGKDQNKPDVSNSPLAYLHMVPLSKDLIIYSAYFDERARNGHRNVTIFLLSINKTIFDRNWITGCGVGSVITKLFKIRLVQETILMHKWLGENKFPFEQLALDCYDLPVVVNGSRAFVVYMNGGNISNDEIVVESLNPLMIPAPRVQPLGKHNLTVVTCTKAHNRGVSWLPEFIRYQNTIGVDHVHLSMLDTFIKDNGFLDYLMSDRFVRTALQNGYLSITVWNEWYRNDEFYVHGSILQYLDCFYHFRGTYDYVFPMDSDDFFNPSVPGKTQLKDYIVDFCYSGPAVSCKFQWLFYYPGLCGMAGEVGQDGNVTKHLNPHKPVNEQAGNMKSVHSTKAVVDFSFHDATCASCLLPGYEVYKVQPEIAYVAHNRMYIKNSHTMYC